MGARGGCRPLSPDRRRSAGRQAPGSCAAIAAQPDVADEPDQPDIAHEPHVAHVPDEPDVPDQSDFADESDEPNEPHVPDEPAIAAQPGSATAARGGEPAQQARLSARDPHHGPEVDEFRRGARGGPPPDQGCLRAVTGREELEQVG